MARLTKAQQAERQEAIETLRGWLRPGDTVYTILRHVSRSGMRRVVGVVVMVDGEPRHPNWLVATACGFTVHPKGDGIIVDGCGMDMGFHLAYELGHTLWPDGFDCPGDGKCAEGNHWNRETNTYEYGRHNDGYALNHRWL